jgi:hypothetical protein
LEGSIFNTPVPFRERWVGELIADDKQGVLLRLTRHDGKAVHEYPVVHVICDNAGLVPECPPKVLQVPQEQCSRKRSPGGQKNDMANTFS